MTMIYQIEGQDGKLAAEIPHADKIAAQNWAMTWVKTCARPDDYFIMENGRVCARLLHTATGQWYLVNA